MWMIEEAIKQQLEWKNNAGFDISISINVSVLQFQNINFEARFLETVHKSGINKDKIDIEITESLFLHNTEQNLNSIHRIHKEGISFSLDDFGTGYSSLSYLKTMPIQTLKIDRLFILDYDTEQGAIFLKTIINMAHGLNLEVICEGVELEQQREFLQSIDCEYYQGYLCSKPVPAKQFANLYNNVVTIPIKDRHGMHAIE